MLSSKKQQNKPSLVGIQSLQEAIQVLNARRAPRIYTSHLTNMFKVDLTNPASKTWLDQQLRETENTLNKDEKDKEVEEKKLMGYQQNMKETEGNPSSGQEHPKEMSIADKTGASAQNDGSSVDDIIDKNPPAEAPEGAHAQKGESQLKEAIEKVYDVGNGVDPMNQSVIAGMANGMSQIEATNAASADNNLMEAVFNKQVAKLLVPIFKAQAVYVDSLKETIIGYDQKLEAMRRENKGLNEAVQIIPGQKIIIPDVPVQDKRSLADHRNEISEKLHDTIYN